MPEDPRGTIISAMMKLSDPTNLAQISKLARMPIQNTDYWVQKLEEEGVVLCDRSGEQSRYFLQPLFYESDFAQTFDKRLQQLYDLVANKVEVLEGQDKDSVIFYTLLSILHAIAKRERR